MKRLLRWSIVRRLIRTYRDRKYRWLSASRIRRDGFDRRHGTDTSRIVQTKDAAGRDVHWYETASASAISAAIEKLGIDPEIFTFIDLGCGKGKPLLIAAGFPFRRIIGVDVDASCLAIARKNVGICEQSARIELVVADATRYAFPPGPLLVYLYNPFPGHVLRVVLQRLACRLDETADPIAVIYMHPRCAELIEDTGLFRTVYDLPGIVSPYERALGFVSAGRHDSSVGGASYHPAS